MRKLTWQRPPKNSDLINLVKQLYTNKLSINNTTNIYEVSNNVFTYDKIDCTDQCLKNIASNLDKGMTFFPSIINKKFE